MPFGIHLIRGDSAGGALKQAGANPIIVLADNLAVGPSSRRAGLHSKIRLRYWRQQYEAARFDMTGMAGQIGLLGWEGLARAVAEQGRDRTVVWASGVWNDLLMLGWFLDKAAHELGERRGVTIAGDLRLPMPLGWLNPEQLLTLGRDAAPVSNSLGKQLVETWRAFTAPTPAHLERLCQAPPAALPTLQAGVGLYASFLPRLVRPARRLRLSLVDEVLLRVVPGSRFVRFPDLFKGASPSKSRWPKAGLFPMLQHFGELFIQARLAAWSTGADPAIQQVALPRGTDPGGRPYNTAWRLTERGRRLVERGLDGPEDSPGLLVGGYSSEGPECWCCAVSATSWQMMRL